MNIRLCTDEDLARAKVGQVAKLINDVYSEAEEGMWQPGFQRVSVDEVVQLIKERKLIFAESEEGILGSIFVTKLSETLGEFGMLVCHPKSRHQGIGRALIKAAEDKCRREGCRQMQLELLYPKEWPQKTKEILKVWYPKLGYQKGEEQDFNKMFPQLAPVLATECLFSAFTKNLEKEIS